MSKLTDLIAVFSGDKHEPHPRARKPHSTDYEGTAPYSVSLNNDYHDCGIATLELAVDKFVSHCVPVPLYLGSTGFIADRYGFIMLGFLVRTPDNPIDGEPVDYVTWFGTNDTADMFASNWMIDPLEASIVIDKVRCG
jgi:hypothetical protein